MRTSATDGKDNSSAGCPDTSSQAFVYDLSNSSYLFDSSPTLIADVQSWLAQPAQNFGWLLKSADETTKFTARRFASREYTNAPPLLSIEFIPPPRISAARISGNQIQFSFAAEPGQPYSVEYQNALNPVSGWILLTNVPASAGLTNVSVAETINAARRFYRVVVP